MASYCLVSALKGVCHLPGNNGFSSLVTHELELRCADSVNRADIAGPEPSVCGLHRSDLMAWRLPTWWGFHAALGAGAAGRGVGSKLSPRLDSPSLGVQGSAVWSSSYRVSRLLGERTRYRIRSEGQIR